MGKKRRGSILKRNKSSNSAIDGAAEKDGGEANAAGEARRHALEEKENQEERDPELDASAETRQTRTLRNRRVSFGRHIACKDMDTGRITNLRIPVNSTTSSLCLQMEDQRTENTVNVEMSLDESSLVLNTTQKSPNDEDEIDLSLQIMSGPKCPRELPFMMTRSQSALTADMSISPSREADDSLVKNLAGICPPGATGKFRLPVSRPTTESEDDDLEINDEDEAGFLAVMRRVTRGKVVSNRKTPLDDRSIQGIVDAINDDEAEDDDDKLDVGSALRDAISAIEKDETLGDASLLGDSPSSAKSVVSKGVTLLGDAEMSVVSIPDRSEAQNPKSAIMMMTMKESRIDPANESSRGASDAVAGREKNLIESMDESSIAISGAKSPDAGSSVMVVDDGATIAQSTIDDGEISDIQMDVNENDEGRTNAEMSLLGDVSCPQPISQPAVDPLVSAFLVSAFQNSAPAPLSPPAPLSSDPVAPPPLLTSAPLAPPAPVSSGPLSPPAPISSDPVAPPPLLSSAPLAPPAPVSSGPLSPPAPISSDPVAPPPLLSSASLAPPAPVSSGPLITPAPLVSGPLASIAPAVSDPSLLDASSDLEKQKSFWLETSAADAAQAELLAPSPEKIFKSSVGIDEELPLLTFACDDDAASTPSSASTAELAKDLSSLGALTFIEAGDAINDLVAACGIDLKALDQKWREEISMPEFTAPSSHAGSSSNTLATAVDTPVNTPTDHDAFREALLRYHLADPRYFSAKYAVDSLVAHQHDRVEKLGATLETLQSRAVGGQLPPLVYEWVEGDQNDRLVIQRKVESLFRLYSDRERRKKVDFQAKIDRQFLDCLVQERDDVVQLRDLLAALRAKVTGIAEDAKRRRDSAEAEAEALRRQIEDREELEALKKRLKEAKEAEAEKENELASKKDERRRFEERKAERMEAKKKRERGMEIIKNYNPSKDTWKLCNFSLKPGGFFYFSFEAWRFNLDVSLGDLVESDDSFQVVETKLSCERKGGKYDSVLDDLRRELPVMIFDKMKEGLTPKMWTQAHLSHHLYDVVVIIDFVFKLGELGHKILFHPGYGNGDWDQTSRFVREPDRFFLDVIIGAGKRGRQPFRLTLRFLLIPDVVVDAQDVCGRGFPEKFSLNNNPDARHPLDVEALKEELVSGIEIESPANLSTLVTAPLTKEPLFPYHRFILAVLDRAKEILLARYDEYYGDDEDDDSIL